MLVFVVDFTCEDVSLMVLCLDFPKSMALHRVDLVWGCFLILKR